MYGVTAGKSAISKIDLTTNQACCNITVDETKADYRFIYYALFDSYLELENLASGAAQQNLNAGIISDFEISIPPLPEQKTIAEVLSSLDDKIDLLHRQNKTLEAMAEALFWQWFVEPCKDGSPEGWDEIRLKDICLVITKGTTPTTLGSQFTETGINFIKAESLTDEGDFLQEKFAKISNETQNLLKRSIIESNDVLCTIAGTIGRIAIVDESILPANTNQAVAILRVDKQKYCGEFMYLFLKSKLFREPMDGKIVHAVQPNLSLGEIGNSVLCIPSQKELHNFEELITPIFYKKRINRNKIHTLEELRDTLLPKLMSGEVRVMA
jgi:type I restriction enzyme S subunit